jgi:hypothetical protein
MRLSQQTLRELRDSLSDLRRQRELIDERMNAIEQLVAAVRPENARGKSSALPDAKEMQAPPRGSLRHYLLEALRATPGSNAREIANRLSQDGFRVGGVTSLRQRVSHELARLRRLGVLRRARNQRYSVKQRPGATGSAADGTLLDGDAVPEGSRAQSDVLAAHS